MAVDPEIIHEISIATVQTYRDVEIRLTRLIATYLAQGIDAPTWMVDRLAAIGDLRRAAGNILGQLEEDLSPALREYMAEAYRTGWGAAVTDLPDDAITAGLAQAATATVTRTAAMESLAAALMSDVGARHANVLRHVIDVYRATIAQASALSIAGGVTRRQASQDAYQRFVDQGVASFVDARGRTWRLSSYVEMAVRTVTQRAAVQGQTDRLQSLGLDLVIVSNSPRECPKCRPWEGKVLSISGGQRGRVRVRSVTTGRMVTVDVAGTVDEARRAGLQHPNCTHSLRAFLPGATRVPTGDLSNPNGYKAKERQREIERQIRRWKEREAGALTPEAKVAAAAKVRGWQAAMRDHLKANPELKRLRYREQIGAGNVPPPGSTLTRPLPPAPAGGSGPIPVPEPAKPFHRNLRSLERLATDVQAIARTAPADYLGEGTFRWPIRPSRAVISRTLPPRDADAELAASWLARALGVRVPGVYRTGPDEIWLDELTTRPATQLTAAQIRETVSSPEGVLAGLLDIMTERRGRGPDRWGLDDAGRLVLWDQSRAFGPTMLSPRMPGTPTVLPPLLMPPTPGGLPGSSTHGIFASQFIRPTRGGGSEWAPNPLSSADVALLRRRLDRLAPDFEHIGRSDWLEYARRVLDAIAPYARGTTSLLGGRS